MREILFRGKRLCNNKWMIGSLLCYEDGDRFICCGNNDGRHNHYKVDSETVGQFTGLTDKNGKNGTKIFEGDIVRCVRTYCDGKEMVGHITFEDCCFCVKEKNDINQPAMDLCCDFEVIGNIHDNPELLEVE